MFEKNIFKIVFLWVNTSTISCQVQMPPGTCTLWRPKIADFVGLWKQSQVQNYHDNSLLNFNSERICTVKSSLSAETVGCWDHSTFIVHFYLVIRHLNTHEYILHFRCRFLPFCKKKKNGFYWFERTNRTKEVCQGLELVGEQPLSLEMDGRKDGKSCFEKLSCGTKENRWN